MQHVRIATYEIRAGSIEELATAAREGMLRIFQDHGYRLLANHDRTSGPSIMLCAFSSAHLGAKGNKASTRAAMPTNANHDKSL